MSFLGYKKQNILRLQAGDTIVEVLICIAVLGGAMGGAYAIANQNTRINQGNQDRSSAIKIAESQLELLKGYAAQETSTNKAMNISSPFCLYYNIASTPPQIGTVAAGDSRCRQNSAGAPVVTEPSYAVRLEKEGLPITSAYTGQQIGQRYVVRVSWDSINGTGQDNVTYSYGVYK